MTAPAKDELRDHEYYLVLNQLRVINTMATSEAITDEDLEAFIRQNEKADTLGPLFDPTAWMRASDNLHAITKAARALQVFRKAIREAATPR